MPVFEQDPEATCVKIPLHKNKIIKKTISTFLYYGILIPMLLSTVFIALIQFININANFVYTTGAFCLIFYFVLLLFSYWYSKLYYKTYYYNIKEDSIIIRKGVWFKSQISFPYYRIQDVYIDQDVLDKLFGLYDVHLATAAETSAPLAHIDGLNEENATKIRDLLLEKIKKYGNRNDSGL
ncbi:MAG: PH domain-containing protein [Candidatus Anstonellales archaeon]